MTEGLLASAGRLEAVLSFGASLAALIVFLKILKRTEFEVWKIKFELGYAWVVFSILTIAHLYTGIRFVQRCYAIAFDVTVDSKEAWNSLIGGKLLWFDGLIARVQHLDTASGVRIYLMDQTDLTTWLAHAGIFAMFVSIMRIVSARWKIRIASIFMAFFLSIGNWWIGSIWVVAASELSIPADERTFLPALKNAFIKDNSR